MTRTKLIAAAVAATIALGSSYAGAASSPVTPSAMAAKDKAAVSKLCSQKATAMNLHGKKRKTFRAQCIKNGG